jgi:hypothetical protein
MLTALPKPVMMIEVRHTGVTSARPPCCEVVNGFGRRLGGAECAVADLSPQPIHVSLPFHVARRGPFL